MPALATVLVANEIKLKSIVNNKAATSSVIIKETKNPRNAERFLGDTATLRILARLVDEVSQNNALCGSNAIQTTQIDYFLDLSQGAMKVKAGLDSICFQLNKHLQPRTFLVGDSQTLADLAVWDSLHFNPRWPSLKKSGSYPHLQRWFSHIGSTSIITAVTQKVAAEKKAQGGSFNINLVGAEMGKVCTRFPPEPSGYLHIGHMKAALLNHYFAREYKGRLILRFDDTNPAKEKDEYVINILADLKTMGIDYDVLTHTSDHFLLIEQKARWMIENGKAYVDDTPVEKLREDRKAGIASPGRSASVVDNMTLFEEMLAASERGKQCVLRAKIDMKATNLTLRDPVMYRCNDTPHHRTGTRFKCYPTYDFACPIVDSIEGVTHTLRTTEYLQRDEQYQWFLTAMEMRAPHIWSYSRIAFVKTLMSKRNLGWFVDEKKVDGWNDPRFPTVQGILRRGMQVSALKEFILLQGASQTDTLMQWDKLWSINKKHIDPIALRYTALSDNQVPVRITNFADNTCTNTTSLLHPKNPAFGSIPFIMTETIHIEHADALRLSLNEEFTAMNWGNMIIRAINMDGERIIGLDAELHLAGNVSDTKTKLTWLPVTTDPAHAVIDVTFEDFAYLITVDKVFEGQNFRDFIDPNSRVTTHGKAQAAMANLTPNTVVQVQRVGYFRVDSVNPLVLFKIPTGKTKDMSGASSLA
jgi:glutamyl-tRNA synthetase